MGYYKNSYKSESIDVIGVLATDEEIQEETGKSTDSSVFVNPNSGYIHYYIKLISRIPGLNTYGGSSTYFMGYLSCINGYEDKDNVNDTNEVREEKFREFFKEFFFIFNFEQPSQGAKFCKLSNAHIVKKKTNNKELYIPIPFFNCTQDKMKKKGCINYKEFVSFIKKEKNIGTITGFKNVENSPFFIIWQEDDKTIAIGPFKAR